MGNTYFTSSRTNIKVEMILGVCGRVNRERFSGVLNVRPAPGWGTKGVAVGVDDETYWTYWITDTQRRVEYGTPRPGWDWILWIWHEMSDAMAREWNGRHSGDCEKGTWAPGAAHCSFHQFYIDHHPWLTRTQKMTHYEHAVKRAMETAPRRLFLEHLFSSERVVR